MRVYTPGPPDQLSTNLIRVIKYIAALGTPHPAPILIPLYADGRENRPMVTRIYTHVYRSGAVNTVIFQRNPAPCCRGSAPRTVHRRGGAIVWRVTPPPPKRMGIATNGRCGWVDIIIWAKIHRRRPVNRRRTTTWRAKSFRDFIYCQQGLYIYIYNNVRGATRVLSLCCSISIIYNNIIHPGSTAGMGGGVWMEIFTSSKNF